MADKFESGYTEVRGWWFNVSDVLVHVSRNTVKDFYAASQYEHRRVEEN